MEMDTPIILSLRISSMCLMRAVSLLYYLAVISTCGYFRKGFGASEASFQTVAIQADKKLAWAELSGFVVG